MKKIKQKLVSYTTTLRRINRYILDKNTRKMLLFLIPLGIIVEQAWILDNYLVGQIINLIANQKTIFLGTPIVIATTILIGYYIFGAFLRYILAKVGRVYSSYITNKAQQDFWTAVAKLEVQDKENPDIQNAISDAQRNYSAVNDIFGTQMSIVESAVTFIASMAVLSSLEWWYSLVIVLMVLPGLWLNRTGKIKNYYRNKKRNELGRYRNELSSHLGTKETMLHGSTEYFLNLYQSLRSHLVYADAKYQNKLSFLQLIGSVVRLSLMGIIYYAMFLKMKAGLIPVGSILLLFASIRRLEDNLSSILGEFINLEQKVRESNDFFMIIDLKPSIPIAVNPIPIDTSKAPAIEFDDVWFKYPGTDEYVLKGVSFKINAGERIGIIGENGSGKTTLSLLLVRMYDTTKGSIRINGIDIRLIDRSQLFSITGAVFQDFKLFETRLKETIRVTAVGKPYDFEDILIAAKKVGLDDFISTLPDQYDHKLGRMYEGGIKLSGGKKQKLAIAGLLYRDSKLVILDELTSALSPTAEQQIIEQYGQIIEGKTCVVICHRYKSLQFVQKVLVLDQGVVVENGTHRELMAQNGLYAKLFSAAQLQVV